MPEDEYNDEITEDPDEQVDDDEMSPTEAAFTKGAEEAEEGDEEKKDKEDEDDDEVN